MNRELRNSTSGGILWFVALAGIIVGLIVTLAGCGVDASLTTNYRADGTVSSKTFTYHRIGDMSIQHFAATMPDGTAVAFDGSVGNTSNLAAVNWAGAYNLVDAAGNVIGRFTPGGSVIQPTPAPTPVPAPVVTLPAIGTEGYVIELRPPGKATGTH